MKLLLLKLRSLFPSRLPTGRTQFTDLVHTVVLLSGLPDNASIRQAIAQIIMQMPPSKAYVTIRHIVNMIVKAAATQTAILMAQEATEAGKTDAEAINS